MNILSKSEILTKGKEFSVDIGFDPYTGLYIEMDTEKPYNGIGYTLFSNGEIESYTYYANGIEDIHTVEFYSNGKPMTYCDIKNSVGDGEIIKWNEKGIMIYWAEFEADVQKRFKEWNDNGELVGEKKQPTLEDLEKIREIKSR